MTKTQITVNGREFTVYDHGRRDGPAILYHHGTPTSGAPVEQLLEEIDARGARWISYDRPGYGDSTRHPGRRVSDVAADSAAILDALGADRFATWGISGGGPHALACAALLPERCSAIAALGSVGPFEASGLNYFAGMGRENWVEFGLALAGSGHLEPHLREQADGMIEAGPDGLVEHASTLIVGPDREAMRGHIGRWWANSLTQAFKGGVAGWLDDDLAFIEPFGFELSAIRVPALVVHGRQDAFVPVVHGEWLSETVPNAEAWILDDEGHLSLLANRVAAVFDWLLGR